MVVFLTFTSVLVLPSQVYGQSDPFSSLLCASRTSNDITGSGDDGVNSPLKAMDKNIETRWSNLGLGSWVQIDLGENSVVCSVGINWHRGNERVNTFVISLSTDGKTFTNVFTGKSDGVSLTEQNYDFQQTVGRYIRVTITGNSQNMWASIAELKIYGHPYFPDQTEDDLYCADASILEITAPSQEGHPPQNVLDNNFATVWSTYGVGSSIEFDLSIKKSICGVDIAWYKGNERQANFVISTSLDGKSYKPVLTATTSGKTVSYENYKFSETLAQYVKITVNGNTQNNYATIAEVRIKEGENIRSSECIEGEVHEVKTSGSQASFPGNNVLDDDLNTRWSNNGVGSWIQLDLGSSNKICDINIAWYKGNERQNNFVMSTSTDGIKFSNVFGSKSSGSTTDMEKYDIDDTNARYIRITVNGNTQNSYASITEISIGITSIPSSNAYSIGAAGDWGSGRNDNWKKTVKLMVDNKVNLALGLGDYSYSSVSDFQPVVDELKKAGIPMKGGHGDHDSYSYAELFGQPSMVYAFNAGSARIIILDSYESPSSNAATLEKELKATSQPWKIVVVTTPLYTSPSNHDPDDKLTKALQPLLDKYEVDLVLWGDNHNYERIKFPNKHTLFIQSGTGGESHYKFDGQIKESVYQNDTDFGITKLTIDSNTLSGQFIAHSGKTLDIFNLSK
jgi:hypothetical protein